MLDKKTADKIAAGEVVDRPVSIVKELVENSIDAGSTWITIEIKQGGKSYIRVTDNGLGIAEDDVETAFKRHATSKISDAKDLDSIVSLGFRGEALASICAVSRVELISKQREKRTGRRIVVEGSEILQNNPTGCPDGTTIIVKDLFYNTPARRKFLSSDSAEARRIIDFASRIALSYPDIRFNLINSTKQVFATNGKGDILSNIVNIYGADISKALIPVNMSEDNFTIKGFVSDPGSTLSSRNRQVFCINGRIVSSQIIDKAIDMAYKERLFAGRYPVAFLFIAIPPDKLDVNIHPTKKEIRFDDNTLIEDFVKEGIKQALLSKEAIPNLEISTFKNAKPDQGMQMDVKYAIQEAAFEYNEQSNKVDIKNVLTTLSSETDSFKNVETDQAGIVISAVHPFEFDDLIIIGSVFNTYIAAQDKENFYLIDQHAAHERIFYERLMKQHATGEKALQELMFPMNFKVSAQVSSIEDSWINDVRGIGYDIEFFGNNTYIVRSIPAFMEMQEAEYFLNDLFNQFDDIPDLSNKSILEKIIMRACKAAVKAGDSLDSAEIKALLKQLKDCNNPYSCPHGRPVFIKLSNYEIEKMFKRV
ncbi:MAG: DNA mismatch repair endonuclease MutL [Eubacteriales bacterium]|nr:DNA mismatch repair endonuclease MutL [Eubacteriales bacterium]